MPTPNRLLLVDGSSLAFRMFFALERTGLSAPDGRPSYAVYGFLKNLFEVIVKLQPTAALTAFDTSGATFRQQKHSYYKANRPDEMPLQLRLQWPEILRGLQLIGLSTLSRPGLEADDIVGALSHQASQNGWEVYILSGDRDTFQLVNSQVSVLYPAAKGGLLTVDQAKVKELIGVNPEQIVDYKALAGDSSDNIPGVAGIGAKTAIALLEAYTDLDGVYANLDQLKPAVQNKLLSGKNSAYDSRFLAQIDIHCEFGFQFPSQAQMTKPDPRTLLGFLEEYDFKSLKNLLPKVFTALGVPQVDLSLPQPSSSLETQTTSDILLTPNPKLSDLPRPGYYTDSQSLQTALQSVPDSTWTAAGLFAEFDHSGAMSRLHVSTNFSEFWVLNLNEFSDSQTALKAISVLLDFLHTLGKPIYMYDAKAFFRFLIRQGLSWDLPIRDVLLAAYLENSVQNLELSVLARKHLSMADDSLITQTSPAWWSLRLGQMYDSILPDKVAHLWREIENPLVPVLADMEESGVYINAAGLALLAEDLQVKADLLEQKIKSRLPDPGVNLASSRQLGQALLDMGFQLKKTKTGHFSTDRKVLETLAVGDQTGLIADIMEHRILSKLHSTYTENLIRRIDPVDNRLHGEFDQAQTATGRISSRNPNLQNIPIKNPEYGHLFRAVFAAPKGRVLLSADYSQIELRFLAHFSRDPVLMETFAANQDVHARTAAEIFEIPLHQVTSAQRRVGKTLNFALVYQQGAFATAGQLGISNQQAADFIQRYFRKFPNIKPFIEQVLLQAADLGYVETWQGRRRYFANLKSSSVMLRKADERAAFNAVLQGSNADLTKMAMLRISASFAKLSLPAKLLLQVHDELVFEVDQSLADQVLDLVKQDMLPADPLLVPVVVEAGYGDNWAACK